MRGKIFIHIISAAGLYLATVPPPNLLLCECKFIFESDSTLFNRYFNRDGFKFVTQLFTSLNIQYRFAVGVKMHFLTVVVLLLPLEPQ